MRPSVRSRPSGKQSTIVCASLVALAGTWASNAAAGNDDEVLIGIDATLSGGAVTAVVSDGSSLWYNPAGLGGKKKNQVDVSGTAYTLRRWHIPDYLRGPDGSSADGDTTEAVVVPSAITYVRTGESGWSFGGGYFLTRWSDIRGNSVLNFPDQGSEAAWQDGYVQTYSLHNVVLGASYQTSPKVSVGFGLIGMYNGFNYSNQVSGGLQNGDDSAFITASEQGYQSHAGLQLTFGLQYAPNDDWKFGLGVRSAAVSLVHSYEQNSFQSAAYDLTQVPGYEPQPGDPLSPRSYTTSSATEREWKADWLLPPRTRLGIARMLRRGWISVDVDYQPGTHSQPVQVGDALFTAADRQAVFNARVGFKTAVGDMTSIGAGVFTDRAGDKNALLGVGIFDFYGFAIGAELSDLHHVEDEERTSIRFATAIGVRYAYGAGRVEATELKEFYQIIGDVLAGEDGLTSEDQRAHVHEMTFNLGAGIYF